MASNIALIGSGIFAKEEHAVRTLQIAFLGFKSTVQLTRTSVLQPAIRATPLLTLKVVYSRSLKSAQALASDLSDVELYSEEQEGKTFEDLLKRDDITGFIIA